MGYQHELTDAEKKELLRIARATLKEFLISGRVPPGKPHKQTLLDPAGVFVSLHLQDKLRGCIGQIDDAAPLYKAVQEMVIAAANRDPRFEPVTVAEADQLTIEISVLGPRVPLSDLSEIQIGTHGVSVQAPGRRGVLLPQVAAEQGWDGATFVARTCEKAGIDPDQWQSDDVTVEVFTAQVFAETEPPPSRQSFSFAPKR